MTHVSTADFLATVVAATRHRVMSSEKREPLAQLERRAAAAAPRGDQFLAELTQVDRVNVIAECKRRSPSKGILRADYDPVHLARQYAGNGAAAISVLTEPTFFDGHLDHLRAIREAVDRPLLCKDFVLTERQLLEARAAGADAVLLITEALSDTELRHLLERAAVLGLSALVEAHEAVEVRRAVDAGAAIIGMNSRNLRTLAMSPDAPEDLICLVPSGIVCVAESGIRSAADIARLRRAGFKAFLVGESLVVREDAGAALRALISLDKWMNGDSV